MLTIHYISGYKIIEYNKCNIYIVENIIGGDDCDILRDKINNNKNSLIQRNYTHGNNVLCEYSMNDNIEINHFINEKMLLLSSIISKINKNIKLLFHSGYTYRKIFGPTKLHCDNTYKIKSKNIFSIKNETINNDVIMIRNSSIIFTLNDDYNGGIFNFKYHNINIKLAKGSVIIFPPFWTHPHSVSELLDNTFRYTINTWSLQNVSTDDTKYDNNDNNDVMEK